MKNNLISILIIIIGGTQIAQAQSVHFTNSGVIEYEKRVNMYAFIKKITNSNNINYMQQVFDAYKLTHPQFMKMKSNLTFNENFTSFNPVEVIDNTSENYFNNNPLIKQNNLIYTDLSKGTVTIQKKIIEETFLLKDSIRKINWKITNETRDILGFHCKRANALILDSVYVVAFYTDEIPISGGPESFAGLPGMILGIALPHENITWFASKITEMPVSNNSFTMPLKGKNITSKDMRATIQSIIRNFGSYGPTALKLFLL